jgi:hypothetical protein
MAKRGTEHPAAGQEDGLEVASHEDAGGSFLQEA